MTSAISGGIPFLITRPAGKADNLLASLDRDGIAYLYQPLITASQVSLKTQDLQLFQEADAIIFVSDSAVSCLQNKVDAALLTAPLFAVGQTTAMALQRWLAREVIVPEDQRSEGLL